ncbi:type IV pilus modification protein PilV [Caenimonas sedimenti]|uniref:Type IV pilus modification protein PilV n=1 Tax=Caenimonas sedimenti TaxID=2596921 RepID=A0A562ZKH0_9BURK|nr:type IV pilus modification protein PilV [Caenimonas sedimenti]TWO69082.1 type IV pilus modification protein PilV [Caenimonas sedimenti]
MKTPFLSRRQSGATLLEVLVTVLILSFGMLALGGMMAYAIQLPKMSGNRATAMMLAASHVERMRANVAGFRAGNYSQAENYEATVAPVAECAFPNCTASGLANYDKYQTTAELRRTLAGSDSLESAGFQVTCPGGPTICTAAEGDLWVLWQEPSTFAGLDGAANDECPTGLSAVVQPRCIHIKFRL